MRFPAAIAHMRAGGTLNAAVLHYLGFKDDPYRVHSGFGSIVTNDSLEWRGIGDVVSIDGGGQQAGIVANNMTLTLAASSDLLTDELMAKALDSENQVYGRRYFMAIQFCDEAWQPVDSYFAIYIGVMDRMTFRRRADMREITLNVESPFVRRRTPRLEMFTDRDQKSKYADDEAFEFVSSLVNKSVKWPKYT